MSRKKSCDYSRSECNSLQLLTLKGKVRQGKDSVKYKLMKIYKTEIRVPFADTDGMGIVYHTNYIKYFEVGRTEYLREIGYPYSKLEAEGIWLPVSSVCCEYKSPARYDDLLLVSTWVKELKNATIIMAYEISRKGTDKIIAKGETKHPITNDKLKPVRLKDASPNAYKLVIANL